MHSKIKRKVQFSKLWNIKNLAKKRGCEEATISFMTGTSLTHILYNLLTELSAFPLLSAGTLIAKTIMSCYATRRLLILPNIPQSVYRYIFIYLDLEYD